MKDRFRFRAWDTEEDRYVSDDDICFDTGGSCDSVYDLLKQDDRFYIYEQCTGMKDKTGKLIYEGDIVRWNNRLFGTSVVEWEYNPYTSSVGLCAVDKNTEIIGNIHENFELLEVE